MNTQVVKLLMLALCPDAPAQDKHHRSVDRTTTDPDDENMIHLVTWLFIFDTSLSINIEKNLQLFRYDLETLTCFDYLLLVFINLMRITSALIHHFRLRSC